MFQVKPQSFENPTRFSFKYAQTSQMDFKSR